VFDAKPPQVTWSIRADNWQVPEKVYLEHILPAWCHAPRRPKLPEGTTMREMNPPPSPSHISTRRQIIATAVMAAGGLALAAELRARAPQESTKQIPSAPPNDARTALHQEVAINAAPPRIYEALLDAKQFAAFSGLPAEIDPKAGGAFTMFGGQIVGRNVELTPNTRIVQAWRPAHWDASVYSIVRFDLKPQGPGTLVVLEHYGFPQGEYEHLYSGWISHYWDPLKKFLP
jgi:activator of HSP90 ATPase